MKSTGIVRRLDELGRIVIPKELRNQLDIKEKEQIEVLVENDMIVLRKFNSSCVLCGRTKDLYEFKNKSICIHCIREIDQKLRSK